MIRRALIALALLAAAPAHAAPAIQLTGLVAHPGPVGTAALAAMKQVEVEGSFDSMSGRQTHRWRGPLLLDVLNQASITDAPGKRTHMQHIILAYGTDGYGAAVALGEIDAKGEGKQVIVALAQDGQPMAAPRLIVPHDASLTRCVHDLDKLDVR